MVRMSNKILPHETECVEWFHLGTRRLMGIPTRLFSIRLKGSTTMWLFVELPDTACSFTFFLFLDFYLSQQCNAPSSTLGFACFSCVCVDRFPSRDKSLQLCTICRSTVRLPPASRPGIRWRRIYRASRRR